MTVCVSCFPSSLLSYRPPSFHLSLSLSSAPSSLPPPPKLMYRVTRKLGTGSEKCEIGNKEMGKWNGNVQVVSQCKRGQWGVLLCKVAKVMIS